MKMFKKLIHVTEKGYTWNRSYFLFATLILLSIVFYIISINGINPTPYVICNQDICLNPLLEKTCNGAVCPLVTCTESWCTEKYLTMGTYGKKPLNQSAFFLAGISLFLLAFVLNHFHYNLGKKIDFEIEKSPIGKLIKNIQKLDDKNKK